MLNCSTPDGTFLSSTSRLQRLFAPLFVAAVVTACGSGGNSGTPPDIGVNVPTPAPVTKTALQFFGTGLAQIDRVKIPLSSTTAVNVGATDFTLEFWIKGTAADNTAAGCSTTVDGWRTGNVVLDRDVNGAADFGDFGVSLFAGRVAFGVARGAAGATICGTRTVLDGNWHHVAVTRQRATGQLQLFIDGTLDVQMANNVNTSGDVQYNVARATTFPASDPFLMLGAEKHDTGVSFRGLLDEVRVSNTLRYAGSFSRPIAAFVTDANTMALYHFDEGSGTAVGDAATGTSSPGTLAVGGVNSGPKWVTDTPF